MSKSFLVQNMSGNTVAAHRHVYDEIQEVDWGRHERAEEKGFIRLKSQKLSIPHGNWVDTWFIVLNTTKFLVLDNWTMDDHRPNVGWSNNNISVNIASVTSRLPLKSIIAKNEFNIICAEEWEIEFIFQLRLIQVRSTDSVLQTVLTFKVQGRSISNAQSIIYTYIYKCDKHITTIVCIHIL